MHGYKQDKYGNFHPVEVPDSSDRRAQGPGPSQQTQAVLLAIGNGASVASSPDGSIRVVGNMPGAKVAITWNIRADGSGTFTDAGSVNNLGPGSYQPSIILAADRTRSGAGSAGASGQTQAVLQAISNGASLQSFPDGSFRVSGTIPGAKANTVWVIRTDGSGTIKPHDSSSATNLGPGTYQPNIILAAYHRQPARTSGASGQTQAVLKAIGNGASLQSFPDGSLRISGVMPGAKSGITWSIRADGSGTIKPHDSSSTTNLGPGTYQPNIILSVYRKDHRGGRGREGDRPGTVTIMQTQNVYDTPSAHARVVGTVGPGPVRVPVLQRQAGWIRTTPPGWRRSGWIQLGAAAVGIPGTSGYLYGPAAPMAPTLSGVALPNVTTTLSGIPAAPVVGYQQGYTQQQQQQQQGAYTVPFRAYHQPLPFAVPQVPVGGIDPALLQVLLQEAQAQGVEAAALQALIGQIASVGLSSAAQQSGLDLQSILSGAGMTLDTSGLPVPTDDLSGADDSGGADFYADGGVDPTGGGLGDYTDPRSQD